MSDTHSDKTDYCNPRRLGLISGLHTLRESPSNHYACTSNAPCPQRSIISMAAGYDTQDFLGTDTTPEQYAHGVGVNPELLDREFPSTYDAYLRFGRLIPNWAELAPSLGLRRGDIQAIRSNLNLTDGMHEREVLKKWKAKSAFNAKYRQLVKAYLDLDREVAKSMCLAIQDYCG